MRGKNSNIIWEYFGKVGEEGAKCKTCGTLLKGNRTNNMKQHLFRMHKITFSDLTCSDFSPPLTPCSVESRPTSKKKFVKVKITKSTIIKSYIGMVTEDGIPFNTLDSQNFRAIVDPICEGIAEFTGKKFRLNASNCKEAVKAVAKKIRQTIANEAKGRLLSLKIDSATRLSRLVFGVSVQFISNGAIQSHLIGMVHLKGPSATCSKDLKKAIQKILQTFGISLAQIVSITSDNGANMIKTTKLLSQSTLLEDELEAEENNELYLRNLEDFENFNEFSLKLGTIQHYRCAAHTAQLCALDVAKDDDIRTNILMCRNFTKFIRNSSNGCRALMERKEIAVPALDCATRWGSTYLMMSDLLQAKCILQNAKSISNKTEDENFKISDDLWKFIEAYLAVLFPLQKIIVKFQEEQLNYSEFFAAWLKCKLATKRIFDKEIIKDDQNSFIISIAQRIINSFEEREDKLLDNEGLISCLYLDPRFQHTLNISQKVKAVNFLCKLWDQLRKNNFANCASTSSTNINKLRNLQGDEDDEEAMLSIYLMKGKDAYVDDSLQAKMNVRTKVEQLSLSFTGIDLNIIQYWKSREFSDPELYALSNVCYAIPPTQVTVRAFSALKLVLSDQRDRLSDELLEDILLVKVNSKFLDEVVDSLELFEI